ncbi:Formylglycine-generating enzyme [Geobacteraceae bacterium]|nr:Formylglycine-generating enzyme [Geobacteraceae bacterium]
MNDIYDIFISYKREDCDRAQQLVQALEAEGWSVWWDSCIYAGEIFDDVIENALNATKCVIVLWSRHSVASQWVKAEAREGLNRKILIPAFIDDVIPPLAFREVQAVDMKRWDGTTESQIFQRIIEAIENILGPHIPPPPRNFRDVLEDGTEGPEMVVVTAGSFRMGDVWGDGYDDEKPVHAVHIPKPFAIGRHQVTFMEYDIFIKLTGMESPDDEGWGRDDRPVINVSWYKAVAYAEWLSQQTGKRYRLPSEAEWEYAARSGGRNEKWAGTSSVGELGDYAWYEKNSVCRTHPVGKKKPNGLGLYDMSGNVSEWVNDFWDENYVGAPSDGAAWQTGNFGCRVLRGGSWSLRALWVRSVFRSKFPTDSWGNFVGFRLAREM